MARRRDAVSLLNDEMIQFQFCWLFALGIPNAAAMLGRLASWLVLDQPAVGFIVSAFSLSADDNISSSEPCLSCFAGGCENFSPKPCGISRKHKLDVGTTPSEATQSCTDTWNHGSQNAYFTVDLVLVSAC